MAELQKMEGYARHLEDEISNVEEEVIELEEELEKNKLYYLHAKSIRHLIADKIRT